MDGNYLEYLVMYNKMKQLADAVPPGEDKQPDQVKGIKRGKNTE
jgi:hypothetical protein